MAIWVDNEKAIQQIVRGRKPNRPQNHYSALKMESRFKPHAHKPRLWPKRKDAQP